MGRSTVTALPVVPVTIACSLFTIWPLTSSSSLSHTKSPIWNLPGLSTAMDVTPLSNAMSAVSRAATTLRSVAPATRSRVVAV